MALVVLDGSTYLGRYRESGGERLVQFDNVDFAPLPVGSGKVIGAAVEMRVKFREPGKK